MLGKSLQSRIGSFQRDREIALKRQNDRGRRAARRAARELRFESLESRQLLTTLVNVTFKIMNVAETTQVSSINVGSDYKLQVYVQDAQNGSGGGVFQAYFDLSFPSIISFPTSLSDGQYHGTVYTASTHGTGNVANGTMLDVGGLSPSRPPQGHEADSFLLLDVPIHVTSAGTGTFAITPDVVHGANSTVDTVQMWNTIGAVPLSAISFSGPNPGGSGIPITSNKLVFTAQPSNTVAGVAIAPAVNVSVEDADGNLITTDTSSVTVSIAANPGNGTLGGTTTVAAVGGVASFTNLSINKSGTGYTLAAADSGLTGASSAGFNITPAAANKLVFTAQPGNSAAGASISPAVQVSVEDANGNLVTGDNSTVTIALGANPGGSTLGGTLTAQAVNGIATFNNLTLNKVGTGYTLTATDGSLSGTTSSSFNITPGTASKVVFSAQPVNTVAGASISPAVQATVEDANGNVVTGDSSNVTIALGANPGNGTLGGTATVAAVNGVATFNNLSINKTGTGYTLTATDGSLTGVTSSAFNITPGVASKLLFTAQPSNAAAGANISPAVVVAVEDANGNLVTGDNSSVTLAIGTNPGGGTLSGTLIVAASGGLATFNNLSINKVGTGYTLTAADGSLNSAASSSFNITAGVASKVVFSTQPSNTTAGASITPAVQVSVEDANGNVVTGDSSNVTLALSTNPGGGTLSGTLTVAAVNGVGTFSDLSLNKAGSGYTLKATDASLANATSTGFNITAGVASKVVFSTQPSNAMAGANISPAVQVAVEDANGNIVTGDNSSVTLAIAANPGSGTLGGTLTVAATGGVATFNNLSINKVGTGYTLTATDGSLSAATSNSFNITPAAASKLVFSAQPSNAVAGASIAPAVQVSVEDASGNLVTTDNSSVTIAIGTNPGGGSLSGTLTVAAVGGVATFNNLAINKSGTGYTLTAADGSLNGGTSGSFNITAGVANKIVFTTPPSNTAAGVAISPAVQLSVEDINGNVVTTDASNVTIALGTNPTGGTLSGTLAVAAVGGVATFGDLSINKVGNGYTLSAVDGSLTGATSAGFNITPGQASKLVFSTEPSTTVTGKSITPAVKVMVEDAGGNLVTGDSSNVTVAIGVNPGNATLGGTLTVAAVGGVATFGDLSVSAAGTGYTLTAADGSLAGATSTAFNVTPVATKLVFTTEPSDTAAASSISPAVQVSIEDSGGNLVTTSTSTVTIALGANPGSGTLSGTLTAQAVNGVATFNSLSINKVGTGYTITAVDGSLIGATSTGFDITPGAASKLVYDVEPSDTMAGASITPAVQVLVEDANSNLVTTDSSNVTLSIGTNPSGGTLGGTVTVAASGGVANFSNLSINKVGTGYTLAAADGSLAGTTSSAFNITPAAAAMVVFTTQPTNTAAGTSIIPAVQVTVEDIDGNVVTGDNSNVTVALGTNPGGGTLSGTLTVAAVNGVATFSGLSIDKMGIGYTLLATDGSLVSAKSNSFNIPTGPAAKLVITTEPTSTTAGASITPAVQITVEDADGNVVTTDLSQVTVALSANPGGGTLGGTLTAKVVNGVATFSNLSINKVGTGYSLAAADGSLTGATSSSFDITPGPVSKLVFTTEPTTTVAGFGITPAVQVSVEDADGNLETGDNSNVTVAIATNPGGGALSGTLTMAAVGGVATFNGLSINKTGIGYTLAATDAALTGATSSSFNITPGAASQIVFTTEPSNTGAGVNISPAVQISVEDVDGNVVTSDNSSVSVAIGTNPSGGTLGGTLTIAAVSGVATFNNLSIDKTGNGYTLAATDGGLAGATSASFNVTAGVASKLVFSAQPSDTVAGASIAPAVQVTVEDADGNVVIGDNSSVTIAIGLNPGGGSLSGTLTAPVVNGVATFNNLSINKAGAGYTLTAVDGELTGSTSSSFNVTAGVASQVVFTTQPSNTVAGSSITPAVQVSVEDVNGNVVTTDNSNVTLGFGTNPSGGSLSGTLTVAAVNGIATFSDLSINKTGTGYTLTAADGSLAGATSSSFNITPAAASQLVFTTQPSNAVAGASIAPAVQVSVEDADGNVVTGDSSSVTLAFGTNAGGGTLGGTLTVAAVNGVATFNNLSIDKIGNGYTLTASDGSLSGTTSTAFNITAGVASKLVVTAQPSNTVAGASITPAVQVSVEDSNGNVVTSDNSTVTIAIGTNPGGGTPSGTLTVAAVNGIATFTDLSINKAGTGYTLRATDGTLTQTTSNTFNITAGVASQLAFTVQPSNTASGASITPAVQVSVEDAEGNVVTGDNSSVTIAIGTNPAGGTLSGTLTASAINGVATFNNLSIDKAGVGYALAATDGSLTGATSGSFNIVAGVAAKIVITTQPSNTVAGASISPAVQVSIEDASGNLVTTNTSNVTIAIGTNPGGGTLSGTLTLAAVGGVATFNNLSLNKVGTGYTLTASDGSFTSVTSSSFNVTPGVASKVVFTTQPSNTVAGASITPAVQVTVEDANGNVATGDNSNVTVAIGTNPDSGTLGGTVTVAAVNGVATFNNLTINKTGTGYTLMASDGSLTTGTSSTFNITAGVASQLVFTTEPSNTAAGASISPAVKVSVEDSNNNVVTGNTSSVTIAIGTNPGSGTLGGTLTVAAVNGVATFSNLTIDKVADGYTLVASSGSLTGATSSSFNITVPANSTLSGYVYIDTTNNGQRMISSGVFKQGIPNVTVTLERTDASAANQVMLTQIDGYFKFTSLPAGTYTLVETAPQGYNSGKDTAGSLGGSTAVADTISQIVVGSGVNGTEYDFGHYGIIIGNLSKRIALASTPTTPAVVAQKVLDTPAVVRLSGASTTNFTASYVAGGSPAAIAASSATITHSGNLASMTVTIANPKDGDSESFVVAGQTISAGAAAVAVSGFPAISASYASGVLTLSGIDTVADYQSVLRTIQYQDAAASPDTSSRIIHVAVNDSIASSNVATTTISFTSSASAQSVSASALHAAIVTPVTTKVTSAKAVDKVMASLANLLAR